MKHTLNQKAMRSSPHPDTPSLASLHKAKELGSLRSGEDLWAPIWHPPSRAISPMLRGISVVSSHPIPVVGASFRFPTMGVEKGRQRSQVEGLKCRQDPTLNRKHVFSPSTHEAVRETCLGQPWRGHGAVLRTPWTQNNQNATERESNHNTQLKTISHLESQ